MDAKSVGVGAAAMQRASSNTAAAAAAVNQPRTNRRAGCDLISAGNYTWCPALDYLADGVTSSVFRCRDNNTGDFYAVKVFKCAPPKREVELLQKLNHENIVRLITGVKFHDGLGGEKTGLVLEYCPGNSLHEYLKKPENKLGMHDRDFLSLLYNMCDGLAYLREQLKIVHRDIKPGNIMISYDNRRQLVFKLADFGSGRELEDGGDFQSLVGTYEFLHPSIYLVVHERMHAGGVGAQHQTGGGHKAECDLWSLGVTLYMAATGRLPFAPFEGVRSNHAQMIEMMVKKPQSAISATQDRRNGPVAYHDSLPPTCPLSHQLQQLLVELLQGILVSNFKEQWSFSKFFETINRRKSQHCTYYFLAGAMMLPDLVFSPKQSLDSLLTSLAAVTGFSKEEIVVFYRSQEVSAFPTGSTPCSPVIVLSKHRFECTLDLAKLDVAYVNSRPREPDPNQPKEVKDYIDEAHRHALVCRQLATACHLNHALTLEAKDAALCLLDRRGREAYQRVSSKLAMISSSQQKVGRLMELAQLVLAQTGCQTLFDDISKWRRTVESVSSRLADLKPDTGSSSSSSSAGEASSLVPSQQLAGHFTSIFARLLAPQEGAECLSAAFHRVEQVYERYSQMIGKFMQKDAQLLADLMRRCFPSDRTLLDRCLDDCQNVTRACCIETLGRVRAGLAEWMDIVQAEVAKLKRLEEALLAQDLEAELDLLHDKVYRGIFDALTAFFNAHRASKESDLTALSKSIQELIISSDLVQDELLRNTQLLKELDELGLRNSGLPSVDSQTSNNSAAD